ncbi:MAG: outer membrane beta-barrel protein [Lewinellaceae bacterium]|nr:outer membrane beta-barrel protein [Saprospiraceae bacterium]MCB9344499.1 outer membrane beta-barrel protein [Lewinellaceae bacterium]
MRLPVFFSLFLMTSGLMAQIPLTSHYLEIGLSAGPNNYSGDLAEKTFVLKETRLGFGAFARYHFSNQFAIKGQVYWGNIAGTDKNASDPELQERSFEFTSNLFEASVMGEWNFLNINSSRENGLDVYKMVPYLMVGIGGVISQPSVNYYGNPDEYDIHVRHALPENGKRRTKALTIPFGAGIRRQINEILVLGGEGCWRPVLSDDLDGVSLNGNPKRRDWFFSLQLSASVVLAKKKSI